MKIVKIRKLDDIADNDWEITLENEGKIYHSHKDFFDIVEKGMALEPPKQLNEKPKDVQTNEAIFFPTEEEQFQEIRKREKEQSDSADAVGKPSAINRRDAQLLLVGGELGGDLALSPSL